MNRAYHKWFSKNLQRDMELLIFGHDGRAVLFFPTRAARFYDYENWGIVEAIQTKIEAGEVQLFCVDSIDAESLYNERLHPYGRIDRHLQYEQYILNEVIPFISTKNKSGCLETAGCSMGAYHAINLAMKYPWLFKKAVGMSGRYDLTSSPGDFKDLFDGCRNEAIYFNMPGQYLSNLTDRTILQALHQLEVILAVGQTDPFLQGNREFSSLLHQKGIPNQFHQWEDNAHRPRYWKQMVSLYI